MLIFQLSSSHVHIITETFLCCQVPNSEITSSASELDTGLCAYSVIQPTPLRDKVGSGEIKNLKLVLILI